MATPQGGYYNFCNIRIDDVRAGNAALAAEALGAGQGDLSVARACDFATTQIYTRVFLLPSNKEQKHYHVDWSLVPGDAGRFENLVACHLQKWVHFEQDTLGRDVELRYFRDIDGREVDFVVVEGRRPVLLVECKWSDAEIDRSLRYLKTRFPATPAWQISATGTKDFISPDGIRVAPALALLSDLV